MYTVVPNINLNWVSSSTTVNKTSSSTELTHAAQSISDGVVGEPYAYVEIDTTGYDTLHIKGTYSCNNNTGSDDQWFVKLTTTSNADVSTLVWLSTNRNSNSVNRAFEKAIDISALSGTYRIRIYAQHWSPIIVYHYATITDCRLY
jgi:hypothetical protein